MPDEATQEIIKQMQAQIAVLTDRLNQREGGGGQQLFAPVDDVTKAVIGAALGNGAGSHALTTTATVSGGSVTVPAAYQGTRIILLDGTQYEIPYISKV